jgi:integrase
MGGHSVRTLDQRQEVAKGTHRAEGDERNIPLNKGESLQVWLFQQMDGKDLKGRIIPISSKQLREKMNVIFEKFGVKQVPNGFRHSAISYYLAMFPDAGVTRVSRWSGNSEATIRKHYLQVLPEERGKEYFNASYRHR